MKEQWSAAPEKIKKELLELIQNETPLTIYYQKAKSPLNSMLLEIKGHQNAAYCILERPADCKEISEGFLLYKKKQFSARGFIIQIIKITKDTIMIRFPGEIFEIQRRKYPRIDTPKNSRATFIVKGKQTMNACKVIDISKGGTWLSGKISYQLEPGIIIGPLTLNLTLDKYPKEIHEINIPEGKITRVISLHDNEKSFGVCFEILDSERELVKKYIDIRLWESLKG
jgi:hypothetical protein